MNILLDECVDRRLARDLAGHAVTTMPRKGWSGIKNGDLLALAAKEFDFFITVDRQLSVEQDLPDFQIAVILLRARSRLVRPEYTSLCSASPLIHTVRRGRMAVSSVGSECYGRT